MKTKEMLISLLRNAELDKLCSYAPCSVMCAECPFYNEQNMDTAVSELQERFKDDSN